jgi:dihydroxyacetone kinase-like predicted kinase
VPQGLAALLGFSYLDRDLGEAVEEMAAAASAVDTGEVSRAERDAIVGFGRVRRGDWLGIADDTIVVADRDLEAVLRGLVAALLVPGARSLTLYTGDGSLAPVTKALEAWLAELHPDLEVTTVDGGQPWAPYLVSLE